MSVDTLVGREISHYRVHERLGSGGMGDVYRATDLRLGRRVALKFLRREPDPGARQRMIHEAQAASLLDHPNLCTIFEADETPGGDAFIAMAYYDGETLDRILQRGPLPVGRALSIAIQAGRGLAAAHEELAVLAELGEPERAARWVTRALSVDSEEPIIEYNAACIYVRLGRFDDALRCLQAALGENGLSGTWASNDPDLDPVRDDPRFRALMDQAAA